MDKREHVLNVALKLFVEFGFHGTPTSKIAKDAGLSSGTLFYFFPTKDDLIKSLYVGIKSRMTDFILHAIKDETSLQGIIKGYYTAPLYWAMENKLEFQFTMQFSNSPYLNQVATEEIKNHITPFLNIIKEGIKQKVLKKIDAELIFALVRGHTFSINQYLLEKTHNKKELDKTISTSFQYLWEMIAAPQAQ